MSQNAFLTAHCFLSFPSLAKPKASDSGEPKYTVSLVVPKIELTSPLGVVAGNADPRKNTTPWVDLYQQAKAVFDTEFKSSGRIYTENMFFKDQDAPNRNGTVPALKYHNLQGMAALSASNRYPVACVDTTGQLVPTQRIEEVFYPGCKVRAVLSFYTFKGKENSGLAINILQIQKVADSTPWGGTRYDATDFFTPVSDGSDNPALYAQPAAPAQYAQPQQFAQPAAPVQYAQPQQFAQPAAPVQYAQPQQFAQPVQPQAYPQDANAVFGVTPQTFHG